MTKLFKDVLILIIEFLKIEQIPKFSLVCREFNEASKVEYIYKKRYCNLTGIKILNKTFGDKKPWLDKIIKFKFNKRRRKSFEVFRSVNDDVLRIRYIEKQYFIKSFNGGNSFENFERIWTKYMNKIKKIKSHPSFKPQSISRKYRNVILAFLCQNFMQYTILNESVKGFKIFDKIFKFFYDTFKFDEYKYNKHFNDIFGDDWNNMLLLFNHSEIFRDFLKVKFIYVFEYLKTTKSAKKFLKEMCNKV